MEKFGIYPSYNYRSAGVSDKVRIFINLALFSCGALLLFYCSHYIYGTVFALASLYYLVQFSFINFHFLASIQKGWSFYKIDSQKIQYKKSIISSVRTIKWMDLYTIEVKKRSIHFDKKRGKRRVMRLYHLSDKRRYAIIDRIRETAKEKGIDIN